MRLPIALPLLLLLAPPLHVHADVVRVGAVAVEDYARAQSEWEQMLTDVAGKMPSDVRWELALGTYGDLLHWMEQGEIDVAMLTPGIYAELLNRTSSKGQVGHFEYVATLPTTPASSPWAEADRRESTAHYGYRAVCLVPTDSPFHDPSDIERAAKQGQVEFLLVHPLSMSGRIVPESLLREQGIPVRAGTRTYAYSHTRAVELLATTSPDRHAVAFVWDDASVPPPIAQQVRRIPWPELDARWIPHDVIVVDDRHALFPQLSQALSAAEHAAGPCHVLDEADEVYGSLAKFHRVIRPAGTADAELGQVSLRDIGQLLLHHRNALQTTPRLAVVLGGGGAKCSYQAGALAAIEAHLGELRAVAPELDIELVVGTSGGAINALPVALGITKDPEGARDFQQVWQRLDQRTIVSPAWPVRLNMGLWFAVLQCAAVHYVVTGRVQDPRRRRRLVAFSILGVGALEVLLGFLPVRPWQFLGTNHLVHHVWLWCSLGLRTAAVSLIAVGIAWALWPADRGDASTRRGMFRTWAFPVIILGLPLLQLVTLLFFLPTLSTGRGVERALAQHFPPLIDIHLAREQAAPLQDLPRRPSPRLTALSQQVLSRQLLTRDLVMTGNCLEQTSGTLPSDLYFYAAAGGSTDVAAFGSRGINLYAHPGVLLDVIMGSSAIFPLFPPRTIRGIPESHDELELIDGGFAHNNPVEAAVLWGATHVIVIEATPHGTRQRRNLVENTAAAFVHLHHQTQLVDARSKRHVDVFTLVPEPPHMCVLDFADRLIAASIERGWEDAQVPSNRSPKRRFHKELAVPRFSVIPSR